MTYMRQSRWVVRGRWPRSTRAGMVMSSVLTAALLLSACAGRVAPPMRMLDIVPSDYYPSASRRLSESGRVVLHFTIGIDGKVTLSSFALDETESSTDPKPHQRLVDAAKQLLRRAKFDTGPRYRRELTASFVFELAPCGSLKHNAAHDYSIYACREPIVPGPNIVF